MAVEAFPLAWPSGWGRTERRVDSQFKMTTSKAHEHLVAEIGRMGGTSIVISSNCPLRQDGKMRMDREPVDPGVAVYFQRDGKGVVFASDKYDTVGQNLRAVGVTIEALRTIERHGTKELTDRAFLGFKGIPAKTGLTWWETLQLTELATTAEIRAAHRKLTVLAHPDQGGSDLMMKALNVARDEGLITAGRAGR